MHFDARKARLLKAGEHLVVGGCPGLRLEVSATRKTWTYRYKAVDTGRMKQVAIGQWPAVPAHEAAALWQQLRNGRAAGEDPVLAKQAARSGRSVAPERQTVRRVIADFVTEHLLEHRAEAGAKAAKRVLDRLCDEAPAFADTLAAEVTRAQAFEVLQARKATPTAAAKLRSLLGGAWDHALDAGRIGEAPNWWRGLLKGKLKSRGKVVGGQHVGRRRRVLSPPEVGTLLGWLPNMHALGRDTTVMYLWTGTRGVEILAMRPEHVGLEGDQLWWTIPKALTKNARFADATDHRVPLFGRARQIVEARIAGVGASGLLFEDARGEQYTQHDFSTYIYHLQPHSAKAKARQSQGLVLPVTDWTPHNLRRTARTLLASIGCPNEVGEVIVGHLPADIVDTYNAYTYDAERVHWLGLLAGRLEQLAGQSGEGLPARP